MSETTWGYSQWGAYRGVLSLLSLFFGRGGGVFFSLCKGRVGGGSGVALWVGLPPRLPCSLAFARFRSSRTILLHIRAPVSGQVEATPYSSRIAFTLSHSLGPILRIFEAMTVSGTGVSGVSMSLPISGLACILSRISNHIPRSK